MNHFPNTLRNAPATQSISDPQAGLTLVKMSDPQAGLRLIEMSDPQAGLTLIEMSDPQAGLTLVEMIVVLAIIALVAALIVPNVIGRPDEARKTVAETDLKTISAALKMYRLDNGDYPSSQQGLKALVERPTTPPLPRGWSGEGYLGDLPIDPWDRPYLYASPAPGGGGFELKSLGKDGEPGGEALDADLTAAR